MRLPYFVLGLSCVAAAACGSTVVEQPTGAGGSGSATATTTTTSGQGGSASVTTGGGGEGPLLCGGFGGDTCPPQYFCDFADDSCGGDDSGGTCQPAPGACTDDCPGVCGCDGLFYCNACTAQALGVDVSTSKACFAPDEAVSGYYWAGGLDHLVIRKKDDVANLCVFVYAAWPMSNAPGFDVTLPAEWGVSSAVITDSAADCDDPFSPPAGSIVEAIGATGTVDWMVPAGLFAPCELSLVDLTVTFPEGSPWAPSSVFLSGVNVPIENGCM